MTKNRQVGLQGEQEAAKYLERLGYRVLERNWRSRFGEIDLICRDGDDLVFVEVKARTSDRFGLPEEAITWRKRQTLRLVSALYLETSDVRWRRLRMEAVAVDLDPESLLVQNVRHFRNIFQ